MTHELSLVRLKNAIVHSKLLLKRIGLLLILYVLCRLLFLVFNYQHFSESNLIGCFWGGLRFDLAIISLTNAPIILLSTLPILWIQKKNYQRFLIALIAAINIPALLFNLIDIEYFKFTSKRSTADIFDFILLSDDVVRLIPAFLVDYWYLVVLFILSCFMLIRWLLNGVTERIGQYPMHYGWQSLALVVLVGCFTILSRGGIQLRPISNLNAFEYGSAREVPLILNSPFSIFRTYGKSGLKEVKYYSAERAEEIYPYFIKNTASESTDENVLIIIMESFGMDYVGKKNEAGLEYTPFMNELRSKSFINAVNGYANGRKSIEALPAIIAGIPAWMNDPYITSTYNGNTIDALPLILKEKGYSSVFFHGGSNGTMGFDAFCESAGFEHSLWREDYPDPADFDGNWGIYDHAFFDFSAQVIDTIQEPYIASIFSLSSHHPYSIPEEFEGRYDAFEKGLARTIRYADDALEQLITQLRKQGALENTVVVITADHAPNTKGNVNPSPLDPFKVPLFFYRDARAKSDTLATEIEVAQHIDIKPTILNLVGYCCESNGSFGRSIRMDNEDVEAEEGTTVQYLSGIYHMRYDDYYISFDGERIVRTVNFKNNDEDVPKDAQDRMLMRLKAMIQQYTNRMVSNQLSSGE